MTELTLLEKYRQVGKLAAQIYAGKDRLSLNARDAKLVKKLEELGFLDTRKPDNGFVGKAR